MKTWFLICLPFVLFLPTSAQTLAFRLTHQQEFDVHTRYGASHLRLGGISAIAKAVDKGTFLLVSDRDSLEDSSNVFVMDSSYKILQAKRYLGLKDVESVRYNPFLNRWFYAFEGISTTGVGYLGVDSKTATLLFSETIPSSTTSFNRGIEGITFGSDASLWVAFESGGGTSCTDSATSFYRFPLDKQKKEYSVESKQIFRYPFDKCSCIPTQKFSGWLGNGVSEILAVPNQAQQLLVLERCFNGKEGHILHFLAHIPNTGNLIKKELVFQFNDSHLFDEKDKNYRPDNLEGMEWGEMKNGKRTLYLVSDDNFRRNQKSQLVELEEILLK